MVVRPLEVATLSPLQVVAASATTLKGGNPKWLLATSRASFWLMLGVSLQSMAIFTQLSYQQIYEEFIVQTIRCYLKNRKESKISG